jgi:hypothetical protein
MNFPMYLRNYTNVEFVLAYDIEDGSHRIMPVADALELKIAKGQGAFVSVNSDVYGICSSATGPIIFCNGIRINAIRGSTTARVTRSVGPKRHHFELIHDHVVTFAVDYDDQGDLYTNPYDTELEDVDLFVLLENYLDDADFFDNYTQL